MSNFPKYDDVGGFPLPEYVDKEAFEQFYWAAYRALINDVEVFSHKGIYNYFIHPLLESLKMKINAGVEIVNYPQHIDMYTQFLKPIEDYEIKPSLIDDKQAIIPEVKIIEEYAKREYEKNGIQLELKICITGPIDLYAKKHGFSIYTDLALNLSESIRRFIKNSLINNKYMKTVLVSLDEPSFGYIDLLNVENDDLINIYDKCLEGINISSQIHLHTLNRADIPLQTKNIECLTCEYASNKSNIIPKKELEKYDKFIRVGIARTGIDNIIAENLEKGKTWDELKTVDGLISLIDNKEVIKKNLLDALELYGERLKYIGPDCGVKGWSPPKVAFELLKRVAMVISEVKASFAKKI
ncbi:MAG: hypothetical protein ACP6IY_14155 [Promethearchaeia archaeon]